MHQVISFLILILFISSAGFRSASAQVSDQDIKNLATRLNTVEQVEQLYTIRFNIARLVNRNDLTLKQQAMLSKVMRDLSDEFSARSHYRNAADVYLDYLEFNNGYLTRYNAYVRDSLTAVHKHIATREQAEINSLESTISELEGRRKAVSGLKNRYYTFGGIAAVATVIITIMIGMAKSRSIRKAEEHIAVNREKLLQLYPPVIQNEMLLGSIGFYMHSAPEVTEQINALVETVQQTEDQKLYQKDISALIHAGELFSEIKN